MSAISKCDGLVFRLMLNCDLGPRVHVFDGQGELIVDLLSLRIFNDRGPAETRKAALDWTACHRHELLFQWQRFAQRHAAMASR